MALTKAVVPAQVARIHLFLAATQDVTGRTDLALEHARQGYDLCRHIDDRAGVGYSLNAIGWYLARQGQPEQGVPYCDDALAVLRGIGNAVGQATTLDSLGFIHHQLDDAEQAIRHYTIAIDLYRELGDQVNEGRALACVGDASRPPEIPVPRLVTGGRHTPFSTRSATPTLTASWPSRAGAD